MKPNELDIEGVALIVGYPVSKWPENSKFVTKLILAYNLVPGGRFIRGNWIGPVASRLSSDNRHHNHTWIAAGEYVVDPTRFFIEGTKPYIFIGPFDPILYDGGGNTIRLTRGLIALVDSDDYQWINQWKWQSTSQKATAKKIRKSYAVRQIIGADGTRRAISMHQAIMKPPPEMVVDHIDNNGLNNQKDNLRIVTQSQNIARSDTGYRSNGKKSIYRGVHWEWRMKRWIATLSIEGKKMLGGSFKTDIEAAMAYDNLARKYRGEFSLLNFPDKEEKDGI